MASQTLLTKITQNPNAQIVLSPSGEPTHLQIPWKAILALTESEKETIEILSDAWWGRQLPKRLKTYLKNPQKALAQAVTLSQYRAKRKT